MQNRLDTFFVRHDDIHQYQIIFILGSIDTVNRLLAVDSFIYAVPFTHKNMPQRQAKLCIIIDNQNFFCLCFHLFILQRKDYTIMKRGCR